MPGIFLLLAVLLAIVAKLLSVGEPEVVLQSIARGVADGIMDALLLLVVILVVTAIWRIIRY